MGSKGPFSWKGRWSAMDEREDSSLAHVGTCTINEALSEVLVLNSVGTGVGVLVC